MEEENAKGFKEAQQLKVKVQTYANSATEHEQAIEHLTEAKTRFLVRCG